MVQRAHKAHIVRQLMRVQPSDSADARSEVCAFGAAGEPRALALPSALAPVASALVVAARRALGARGVTVDRAAVASYSAGEPPEHPAWGERAVVALTYGADGVEPGDAAVRDGEMRCALVLKFELTKPAPPARARRRSPRRARWNTVRCRRRAPPDHPFGSDDVSLADGDDDDPAGAGADSGVRPRPVERVKNYTRP